MAVVCNSQLLRDHNIDGHALCPHWDFCHGFGDQLCLQDGNSTSDCIRRMLEGVSCQRWGVRITLEQIRESD